jgi:hypothetical membrane protein
VSFGVVRGGTTRRGVAAYISFLFSLPGLIVVVYILIGVFHNTAPPHIPSTAASFTSLHSWIQYFISVLFWPLSFWHPILTLGEWTVTGSVTHP